MWQSGEDPVTDGGGREGDQGRGTPGQEWSHGWVKESSAVARWSGSNSNIGRRKSANSCASCGSHSYFSVNTSNNCQGFNLVICLSSPGTYGKKTMVTEPCFPEVLLKQSINGVLLRIITTLCHSQVNILSQMTVYVSNCIWISQTSSW